MPCLSRALVSAALAACVLPLPLAACKSEQSSSAGAQPAVDAAPAPQPTAAPGDDAGPDSSSQPEDEPVLLGEKLRPLVDAVAIDPLVSEDFRLLLDGLEWSEVEKPFEKRLGAAASPQVACAYARVHAAKGALKSEAHDARLDAPLSELDGALVDEVDLRKIDPGKAMHSCPDAG